MVRRVRAPPAIGPRMGQPTSTFIGGKGGRLTGRPLSSRGRQASCSLAMRWTWLACLPSAGIVETRRRDTERGAASSAVPARSVRIGGRGRGEALRSRQRFAPVGTGSNSADKWEQWTNPCLHAFAPARSPRVRVAAGAGVSQRWRGHLSQSRSPPGPSARRVARSM